MDTLLSLAFTTYTVYVYTYFVILFRCKQTDVYKNQA